MEVFIALTCLNDSHSCRPNKPFRFTVVSEDFYLKRRIPDLKVHYMTLIE